MNKIAILNIIIETLDSFLVGKLNSATFKKTINKYIQIDFETEKLLYWENKFVEELFIKIPYYKIETTLTNYLYCLSKLPKNMVELNTIQLITSYIEDLKIVIDNKISNEIYYHIGIFLATPNIEEYPETAKKFIQENQCKQYKATSYITNHRAQRRIFEEENRDSLREEISKKRYNQNYFLHTNVEDKIKTEYDKESFAHFKDVLIKIIEILLRENPHENLNLVPYYYDTLEKLEKKCQKDLEKNTSNNEEIQKNLIYITSFNNSK